MPIEIKITANNPLEALANVTAYGILCMECHEVFDTAGAILDNARGKQPKPIGEEVNPAPVPPVPVAPETPVPPTMPPEVPSTATTVPISPKPAGNAGVVSPSSTIPSDSAPAPVTGVPVAAAPTYTLEQISRAGAELLGQHPELRESLMGLLKEQGVEAVYQLDPAQYGAYATALRGLGARI